MTIDQIVDQAPQNPVIQNTLMKMHLKLDHYRNPVCSVSGGSDSDTMLDLIERVRMGRPVTYVFFNTGIEYRATLRHLDALEAKYNVEILRCDATVPVAKGCRQYGVPFISKEISKKIRILQRHSFAWKNEPYEILLGRHPNCKDGIAWWCNEKGQDNNYNIKNTLYLREFLIEHPPTFPISEQCCNGAKKAPDKLFNREFATGLKILGLRQSEGGARSSVYDGCFTPPNDIGLANYRPLWFWTDADKSEYKECYRLVYSDCYEVWGFKRTGCAGCPFNSRFEDDLLTMQQYEPQMYTAAINIFGASYDYTRQYRVYKAERKSLDKLTGQITLDGTEV